jgi:hypothetical protein
MDAAVTKIASPWNAHRVRVAAWSATLAVLAVGTLVALRRARGAFDAPLGVGPLIVTLLVATAILVASRVAVERLASFDMRERTAFAWGGTFALWLVCLGCAPPGVHHFAWLAWLPIVAIEHVSRMRFLDGARSSPPRAASVPASPAPNPTLAESDLEQEHIVQKVVRVRDANGVEAMRGTLVADFAAGQRHSALHVGFCPPLAGGPAIEVEIADGPDASVKVTQAFAHGAAFELRLAEPAEEACHVAVEFSAAARPSV